jgi:hypothetical protein
VKVAIVAPTKSPGTLRLGWSEVEVEVEVVTAFTVGDPEVKLYEAKVTLGFDFGSSSPGGAAATALTAALG